MTLITLLQLPLLVMNLSLSSVNLFQQAPWKASQCIDLTDGVRDVTKYWGLKRMSREVEVFLLGKNEMMIHPLLFFALSSLTLIQSSTQGL